MIGSTTRKKCLRDKVRLIWAYGNVFSLLLFFEQKVKISKKTAIMDPKSVTIFVQTENADMIAYVITL